MFLELNAANIQGHLTFNSTLEILVYKFDMAFDYFSVIFVREHRNNHRKYGSAKNVSFSAIVPEEAIDITIIVQHE